MPFISSQKSLLDTVAQVIANVFTGAMAAPSKIHLATGSFAPTPTSDPTTFTEATFDGYASKTVAGWTAPYMRSNGAAETVGTGVLTWSPTGTTTPNLITGYWLIGGNGDYLGGEAFAAPVGLNGPTTALSLVPAWQTPPGAFSGALIP